MSVLSFHPAAVETTEASAHVATATRPPWLDADPDAWLRHVLAIHFDPTDGTPYWLERQARWGFDPRREIRTRRDLARLEVMDCEALARRPLEDFVPRRLLAERHRWVPVETGGTLGSPRRTLYLEEELRHVFADPFTAVARRCGFPTGDTTQGAAGGWLFAGPTGPHVIGYAARLNARALGAAEPFRVDFDPRWARRLAPGSLARERYLAHIVEQCLEILDSQTIGVLFSTPIVLLALAAELGPEKCREMRGIFYGGLPIPPAEGERLERAFPRAVHLAGYGNTLMGLALELTPSTDGHRRYFYPGCRLHVELVDATPRRRPVAEGEVGRVLASRLDESVLILNLLERDMARRLPPPTDAPWPVVNPGIGDPGAVVPARNPAHQPADQSNRPDAGPGTPLPAVPSGLY